MDLDWIMTLRKGLGVHKCIYEYICIYEQKCGKEEYMGAVMLQGRT